MGETRTSNPARHLLARTRTRSSGRVFERLRHVLWAGLISLALFAITFFDPIDQFLWLIQSRIADRSPSGDVVFVSSDEVLNDPEDSTHRYEVASALDELDRRGVGAVFLDITFSSSDDSEADKRLARAIEDLGPRITLVDRITEGNGLHNTWETTSPEIARSTKHVISDTTDRSWSGFAWELHYSYHAHGQSRPSLGAAIARAHGGSKSTFPVDYGFQSRQIPQLPLTELLPPKMSSDARPLDLSGKVVVIGHNIAVPGVQQNIPRRVDVPATLIDIYAGETLKAGSFRHLRGPYIIALFAALLVLGLLVCKTRARRWPAYAIISTLIPALLIGTAYTGMRLDLSYAIGLLGFYAAFRSRSRWKRRVEMVNPDTGLPKLRALEARLIREKLFSGHVVIAKIQNYERVLKTLRSDEKGSYVLKVVDRLRATDPNLAIYNDGHHLGWYVSGAETDSVIDHLEGLRAIFAAPVEVSSLSVDVGITFGVASIEGDPSVRLAAAVAAAEETSEAHNPIAVAENGSHTDLLWDISLRARIDEAMEAEEIYCVYQPKIDLVSKEVIGVEALVRWHDPARGFISPTHFIQQCEKAGRMEHLTRYVLYSACAAAKSLQMSGRYITMSVNISATLLGDMRIAGIVRHVLEETRFDPQQLVLEITETSRISDYSVAATVLTELKSIGVKISMDDFGVGAASYEAFYELPFDEIKIDRLFVSNMAKDPKARAIVASIAAMGREARITVVAEGLENPQDITLLEVVGCQQVQGFAFSRPVSLTNLLEYNNLRRKTAASKMI